MTIQPNHDRATTGNDPLNSVRAYYLCQFVGWSVYAVFLYLLYSVRNAPGAAVGAVIWCVSGFVGTHLLWIHAKRHPRLTVPQLVRRMAFAILLVPLAMCSIQTVTDIYVLQVLKPHDLQSGALAAHFFQAVLVISLWCTLYFTAQEVRRRRAAEMEALRLALVAQAAQFQTLRSQLNPHFLFNCLNSLRELIEEDRERAMQVVTQLSELLRYTLRTDRVETVSLKEELRAVEDYLSLEKIRFEERLQLRYEIAPELFSVKVPPMLIQTLVENGLKHGIAKLQKGGELSITVQPVNGGLRIQVTNTGALSVANDSVPVGLENARERLRLIYGESASLILRAEEKDKVQAVVTIPLHPVRMRP